MSERRETQDPNNLLVLRGLRDILDSQRLFLPRLEQLHRDIPDMIVIFAGLPAAGKTTVSSQWMEFQALKTGQREGIVRYDDLLVEAQNDFKLPHPGWEDQHHRAFRSRIKEAIQQGGSSIFELPLVGSKERGQGAVVDLDDAVKDRTVIVLLVSDSTEAGKRLALRKRILATDNEQVTALLAAQEPKIHVIGWGPEVSEAEKGRRIKAQVSLMGTQEDYTAIKKETPEANPPVHISELLEVLPKHQKELYIEALKTMGDLIGAGNFATVATVLNPPLTTGTIIWPASIFDPTAS